MPIVSLPLSPTSMAAQGYRRAEGVMDGDLPVYWNTTACGACVLAGEECQVPAPTYGKERQVNTVRVLACIRCRDRRCKCSTAQNVVTLNPRKGKSSFQSRGQVVGTGASKADNDGVAGRSRRPAWHPRRLASESESGSEGEELEADGYNEEDEDAGQGGRSGDEESDMDIEMDSSISKYRDEYGNESSEEEVPLREAFLASQRERGDEQEATRSRAVTAATQHTTRQGDEEDAPLPSVKVLTFHPSTNALDLSVSAGDSVTAIACFGDSTYVLDQHARAGWVSTTHLNLEGVRVPVATSAEHALTISAPAVSKLTTERAARLRRELAEAAELRATNSTLRRKLKSFKKYADLGIDELRDLLETKMGDVEGLEEKAEETAQAIDELTKSLADDGIGKGGGARTEREMDEEIERLKSEQFRKGQMLKALRQWMSEVYAVKYELDEKR